MRQPIKEDTISLADPPPTPAEPTVPVPVSDYHPRPIQPVSRFYTRPEELAPVKMEVGPALAPAPASKNEPNRHVPPSSPTPDAPLVAALRCVLLKHGKEAQRLLEHEKYNKTDRQLLLALMRLAAGISEDKLAEMSAKEVASTLEHLRRLSDQLRCRAPLKLEKICFCKRVEGFGQYEPVRPDHQFEAGLDDQPGERMQVYAEVRNFSSVARQDQHETRLSSILRILDDQRREVATMIPETSIDLSQTPRQDYFLNFQFHVPAKLPLGRYTLKVTVKDVTPPAEGEKKINRPDAERSLDFEVCAPGTKKN